MDPKFDMHHILLIDKLSRTENFVNQIKGRQQKKGESEKDRYTCNLVTHRSRPWPRVSHYRQMGRSYLWREANFGDPPCSLVGFSQTYLTSQQCFSLTTNQHQPAQTSSETNQQHADHLNSCQLAITLVYFWLAFSQTNWSRGCTDAINIMHPLLVQQGCSCKCCLIGSPIYM